VRAAQDRLIFIGAVNEGLLAFDKAAVADEQSL
jgi:hypothetical protein